MSGALIDTSLLLAVTELSDLPPSAAISVITLGELVAGVRLAADEGTLRKREAHLHATRSTYISLSVDEAVAERYGELFAHSRSTQRSGKATDLLIAATAAATGRVLYTLDKQQAALASSAGIAVG